MRRPAPGRFEYRALLDFRPAGAALGIRCFTTPIKISMNWPILILAQFFWVMETAYFGWDLSPGSDSELICDGLVVLITALAFLKRY